MTHHRLLPVLLLALSAACASRPSAPVPVAADAPAPQIAHDVYFTFAEPTDDAIEALIVDCERLGQLPGVVHLVVGPRDESQKRDVNEVLYHVGLHVEFADQAAYDGYLPHPTHQALVAEHVPMMSGVVIYDTLINR